MEIENELRANMRELALMKFLNECIELRTESRAQRIKRLEERIKILSD